MAIPTYDQMFRPILALATEGPVTRQSAAEAMVAHFKLTADEQKASIPSGTATYVRHRVGWAMTGLTKSALIEKVSPRTYRATDLARAFLKEHPESISDKDLAKLPAFQEWKKTFKSRTETHKAPDNDTETKTPLEALDDAIALLNADVRSRLLDAVLKQSPEFFERLVLDVLQAMGYGGSRDDAAQHLGKSGDEGIDGRINQDPLGLDQILVQAKRYASDQTIDRKTVQQFIGSLAGQGVTKGIFITTSSFAESAKEFVLRGSNTKVVLVDGTALLELMLRHHIGVHVERQIEVLDLDQNYFSDEE
jgi:restriction system protein